jgi:hypothetical protein
MDCKTVFHLNLLYVAQHAKEREREICTYVGIFAMYSPNILKGLVNKYFGMF